MPDIPSPHSPVLLEAAVPTRRAHHVTRSAASRASEHDSDARDPCAPARADRGHALAGPALAEGSRRAVSENEPLHRDRDRQGHRRGRRAGHRRAARDRRRPSRTRLRRATCSGANRARGRSVGAMRRDVGARARAGREHAASRSPARSSGVGFATGLTQRMRRSASDASSRVARRTWSQVSPAVRRLLAERGLDPRPIRGTGEGGRITVDDVLAHTAEFPSPAEPAPRQACSAHRAAAPVGSHASENATRASHSVPHTAMRKRIAEHMVQSLLHTAPHVTTVFEADLTAVIGASRAAQAEFERAGAADVHSVLPRGRGRRRSAQCRRPTAAGRTPPWRSTTTSTSA